MTTSKQEHAQIEINLHGEGRGGNVIIKVAMARVSSMHSAESYIMRFIE